MPVRLRLALHGTKRNPLFHLVAINARRARNARPLEHLGVYDPIPRVPASAPIPAAHNVHIPGVQQQVGKEKRLECNVERIRWWLATGAEPTRSVVNLLERGGVLTPPHKWQKVASPTPNTAGKASPASPAKTEPAPGAAPAAVPGGEAAKVEA